jgi:predicted esterase
MPIREFELQNGFGALGKWEFPDPNHFTQARHPLAVLIPSHRMRDLDGNGPDIFVRSQLRDLSRELRSVGFATFRFASRQDGHVLDLVEELELYDKALDHPEIDPERTILVGVTDGADRIAKHYYDYFRVQSPSAAVLLSPTVFAIHLNNLTCPYLLVHGSQDPMFSEGGYERVESAVHHHEMRYGDVTDARLIWGVGRELGNAELDPAVLREIRNWVGALRFARTFRPQEPVAA